MAERSDAGQDKNVHRDRHNDCHVPKLADQQTDTDSRFRHRRRKRQISHRYGQKAHHRVQHPTKRLVYKTRIDFLDAAPEINTHDNQAARVKPRIIPPIGWKQTERQEHEQVLIEPRLPSRLIEQGVNQGHSHKAEDEDRGARRRDNQPQKQDHRAVDQKVERK